MPMKSLKPALVFLSCFLCFSCLAQINARSVLTGHLARVLDSAEQTQPKEKIYLQTDRPNYSTRDNIWFKAYLTAGSAHYLSQLSKVINVVLATDSGQVLLSEKLLANYGLASGDFRLTEKIATGDYYVIAYTNYMLNDGSAFFFRKRIHIDNPYLPARNLADKRGLQQDTAIRFYPEGGRLVYGVNSLIAFAPISAGTGRFVAHGEIRDNTNAFVIGVKSATQAMGGFYLYPEKGKTYHATLTFNDSTHSDVSLPEIQKSGYLLSVYNRFNAPEIGIRIYYRGDDAAHSPADSTLTLIAQSGGRIVYAVKVTIKNYINSLKISKQDFPSGIIQFTLFKDNEPVANRMAWIEKNDALKVEMANATDSKGKITLHIANPDGSAAKGSFSVAVLKNESTKPLDGLDIVNYFSLLSEAKPTDSPTNAIFDQKADSTGFLADLFVLTHKVNPFDWQSALSGKLPVGGHEPEKGLSISGLVVDSKGKKLRGAHIGLFNKDINLFRDTTSDQLGHFAIDDLSYPDSTRLSLRAAREDGSSDISIILDDPFFPPLLYKENGATANAPKSPVNLPTFDRTNDKQLKQVEIKDVRNKTNGASPYSANLFGPGNADYILTAKDLENRGGQLIDILTGKIAGITVDRVRGTLRSTRAASLLKDPDVASMLILVDGMELPNSMRPLYTINPSDIESIEILVNAKASIYGSRGANGVVVFTTKHANFETSNVYAVAEVFRGFHQPHLFSPMPGDSTVFWNANLVTGNDGNISFTLPPALPPGNYSIITEGISLDGKAGSQTFSYTIK